jgi:hypothetical protein
MKIDWIKLNNSRWWYISTFVVPCILTSVSAIYFAGYLAKQKAEIDLLHKQLSDTQENQNRCEMFVWQMSIQRAIDDDARIQSGLGLPPE